MPARPTKNTDYATTPVDAYVGSRIKLRRNLLGISQERLAEEVGITFQQVQKYERGLNRVSAGRLWQIAKTLGVSVNFFFEETNNNYQVPLTVPSSAPLCFCEDSPRVEDDILARKDVIELVRHYLMISDPKVAKNVLDLIKSLSATQNTSSTFNKDV
ncbi:MAG: helix-turn-helix transcriptional regulator [Alphaproteobacteria bacterium]|nr:helix-turn-helix transcriptional regulator [Alphaproteobacteria bacterium]